MEDPILRRRDRTPTITVRGDIAEGCSRRTCPPPWKELQPIAKLPAGYRIEQGGSIEESGKANRALAPLFPIMIALTLITIIVQVRSISVMTMVFATAPLGLIGVIPTLLLFQQPFGINALVGLIALSGILMRNTLILIGQIRQNEKDGLAPFDAVVEATVQRSRPVILTALAAMLAFIPLTHSVFWGTLAYTLIGGTFGGTVLTLVFLPALYAIWFKIKPVAEGDVSERFLSKRKRAAVSPLLWLRSKAGSGDALPGGSGYETSRLCMAMPGTVLGRCARRLHGGPNSQAARGHRAGGLAKTARSEATRSAISAGGSSWDPAL